MNEDHKGQSVASVLRNIRVYLKVSNDYLAAANPDGRLLSAFKIHATTQAQNRLSENTLETVVTTSKKSLRVLQLSHTLLSSQQLQTHLGRLERLQTIDLSYN